MTSPRTRGIIRDTDVSFLSDPPSGRFRHPSPASVRAARTTTSLNSSPPTPLVSIPPPIARVPCILVSVKRWESKNLDEPELRPQEPAAPLPCANCCGFFGSPDTSNLCSKCFRDKVVQGQGPDASSSVPVPPDPMLAAAASNEPDEQEGARRAKAKSRCAACARKVGLMGFECRCGGVFCGAHRYSDRHECGYDYRGAGRDAIAQANPVVRADKVDKL